MKTKNLRRIVVATGILLAASAVHGETGMINMLNLTGARQVAMGETAAAEADPFNLEYNPALCNGLVRGKVGLSHDRHIQERQTNALAAIFPALGADFGIHMRLSTVGDIPARGEIPSADPDYEFSAHDFAFKIFSAVRLSNYLRVGGTIGFLMEKIDIHRATAAAFGLGAAYRCKYGISLHGSLSNMGNGFTFIKERQGMPTIYRLGVGYGRGDLWAAADFVSIKEGDGHLHLGGEYRLREVLFLRAGYQTGYDNRSFSAGAGFVYRYFRIDYAFVPYRQDLGQSHRFSIVLSVK